MLAIDPAGSHAMPRGGAYLIDLHASLSLRNSSQKHIRGVVLAVQAQEVTLAGTKATVSRPSLNVAPGDAFSVPIEQTLTRSLRAGEDNPSVEIQLDGVLFDDLSFYGPDKLHSQRTLTVWDRKRAGIGEYFKSLLGLRGQGSYGAKCSARWIVPQARVQVRGRATNADPDREMQFALLHPPDAPVDLTGGTARISGNEASAPRFEVRSVSKRPVRYMEIGWIVKDQDGHEFLAASLPADLNLAPGQSSQVIQDSALRFPERVTSIQSMKAFVSTVEYDNGSYWILSRKELEDPQLRNVVAPSPEEQRLSQIYLKKGLEALIDELKKF